MKPSQRKAIFAQRPRVIQDKFNTDLLKNELKNNGAKILGDKVRLFHRTSPESKKEIEESGEIFGQEDGVFFSTRKDKESSASGFGEAVVTADIPINTLELDDVFGDEAHLRIPTQRIGTKVNIKDFL
jgi:hypothetical protein